MEVKEGWRKNPKPKKQKKQLFRVLESLVNLIRGFLSFKSQFIQQANPPGNVFLLFKK